MEEVEFGSAMSISVFRDRIFQKSQACVHREKNLVSHEQHHLFSLSCVAVVLFLILLY